MNEKEYLESKGCIDIKGYSLVNNYGYTFILNKVKYDIRFWANCYGTALCRWECMAIANNKQSLVEKNLETTIEIQDYFNKNFVEK